MYSSLSCYTYVMYTMRSLNLKLIFMVTDFVFMLWCQYNRNSKWNGILFVIVKRLFRLYCYCCCCSRRHRHRRHYIFEKKSCSIVLIRKFIFSFYSTRIPFWLGLLSLSLVLSEDDLVGNVYHYNFFLLFFFVSVSISIFAFCIYDSKDSEPGCGVCICVWL